MLSFSIMHIFSFVSQWFCSLCCRCRCRWLSSFLFLFLSLLCIRSPACTDILNRNLSEKREFVLNPYFKQSYAFVYLYIYTQIAQKGSFLFQTLHRISIVKCNISKYTLNRMKVILCRSLYAINISSEYFIELFTDVLNFKHFPPYDPDLC